MTIEGDEDATVNGAVLNGPVFGRMKFQEILEVLFNQQMTCRFGTVPTCQPMDHFREEIT